MSVLGKRTRRARVSANPRIGMTPRSKHYGKLVTVVPGYTRKSGYYRYTQAGEKKFFDIQSGFQTLSGGGTIVENSLNLIDQGTGVSQMVGRQVRIKSIQIKGRFDVAPKQGAVVAGLGTSVTFRLMLILDKQANGAVPTVGQIMQQSELNGMLEMENKDRFSVLKEWRVALNSTSVVADNTANPGEEYFSLGVERPFKYYRKCNIVVQFNDQAGGTRNINEVRSNNLILMGFSTNGDGRIDYVTRIRYTDG